jgi:hypothetical protein
MKEYPIPFTDEMVSAILAGRKTQTRRTSDRYGKLKPGDRLWVKENHYRTHESPIWSEQVFYRADGELPTLDTLHSWGLYKNYSPMFMPRWASRITLKVVSVRAERLQEISEEDALAEGTTPSIVGSDLDYLRYRAGFQTLWESINGKKPGKNWESNPLVWRIEFKVVKP